MPRMPKSISIVELKQDAKRYLAAKKKADAAVLVLRYDDSASKVRAADAATRNYLSVCQTLAKHTVQWLTLTDPLRELEKE